MKRIAIFLSIDTFETWFGGIFGLDRKTYVDTYRNDWAWDYGQALRKSGHTVFIYVLSRGPAELRPVSGGLSVRFLPLPRWHRFADAVLYRLRDWPYGSWVRALVEWQAFRGVLDRALVEDSIDLLYNQEFWTDRFDCLAAGVALPLVGADHGAPPRPRSGAKQASFKRATLLICQSVEQQERVQALGGRAVLVTNGVDTEFFAPVSQGAASPGKSILSVGRLSNRQKRFSDLISALQWLPDYELTILGTGEDRVMLERLAVRLRVAERVRFPGFVSDRSQLRNYYRACGVFVAASAWEAVALVVLEAMSCGAAVVTTRIPTFSALVDDGVNGLLVPVGAPEKLAQAIAEAYVNRVAIGRRARERIVERYAASRTYQRLSSLLESA
jgi:glycosyltransferase involved in cell wall biosynthesis